jgi:hypothetical protein
MRIDVREFEESDRQVLRSLLSEEVGEDGPYFLMGKV